MGPVEFQQTQADDTPPRALTASAAFSLSAAAGGTTLAAARLGASGLAGSPSAAAAGSTAGSVLLSFFARRPRCGAIPTPHAGWAGHVCADALPQGRELVTRHATRPSVGVPVWGLADGLVTHTGAQCHAAGFLAAPPKPFPVGAASLGLANALVLRLSPAALLASSARGGASFRMAMPIACGASG